MTCRPQAPPGNLEWQQNSPSQPAGLDISDIGRKNGEQKTQKKDAKVGKNTTEDLDPVGSTVRYEMMKLCTGSV